MNKFDLEHIKKKNNHEETSDKKIFLYFRYFSLSVDIPEALFTGSVQGSLAVFAHKYRLINKINSIRIEQGIL